MARNSMSKSDLPITDAVPVFNCVVYVSASAEGRFKGRVANLDGIELEAGNQRELMSKIVPAFKERVAACLRSDQAIPWIEPPAPKTEHEQQFLVPVHL